MAHHFVAAPNDSHNYEDITDKTDDKNQSVGDWKGYLKAAPCW